MVTECKQKISLLKNKIEYAKIISFCKFYFIKTSPLVDVMLIVYKTMPEALKLARKKGYKSSFKSFKYLETIEKMIMSNSPVHKAGFALINKVVFVNTITDLLQTIGSDAEKAKATMENNF